MSENTNGTPIDESSKGLRKLSTIQLLNFCLGFFGLQFAWQMRIILSGPVTEGLGASPFIFGLIWLAGPVTGMVVQPIIGALSDNTQTKFGRRRPYLMLGAILAAIALWAFPNSANIAQILANKLHLPLSVFGGLIVAAIMIWIIDACVNAAQGPYRALIPDNIVPEQHSIANSYLSFAIGLGSVIAAGTAPFLKWAFNYQMSIEAQFIMAALAFFLGMTWTCITFNEKPAAKIDRKEEITEKTGFWEDFKTFLQSSPEVYKICLMQFFTWIGVMCMFIFFTQFAIHTVYNVPDLTSANELIKSQYAQATADATNFSSICFAVLNLVCFIVSIPIGILSTKFGNKKIHIISLLIMAAAYLLMTLTSNSKAIMFLMGIAGVGWASILALPFAMLSEYIKKGSEGAVMGIFNIFIAGPQVLVCTVIAWFISKCSMQTPQGLNYHWEYSFLIGAIVLFLSVIITKMIKEKSNS
ncbi:MAG: MFS transporter [Clostridium sp.]|nr:MFS transporter [Clostridium sp.]